MTDHSNAARCVEGRDNIKKSLTRAYTPVAREFSQKLLFDIRFSRNTLSAIVEIILGEPNPDKEVRLVVTANVDHIAVMSDSRGLRQAYERSWIRTIDGFPLFLYALSRDAGVPGRVTGADLIEHLLPRMSSAIHRPAFVVANTNIARRLGEFCRTIGFQDSQIRFFVPDFGFQHDVQYSKWLVDELSGHRATHIFFGLGCPTSEIWVDEHRAGLGGAYALCVGAALGFFVKVERRAPPIVRTIGMEWSWRLLQDPQRLAPRYLGRSWKFIRATIADLYKK